MSRFDAERHGGPDGGHEVVVRRRQVAGLQVDDLVQLLGQLPPDDGLAPAVRPKDSLIQEQGDHVPEELRVLLVVRNAAKPLHRTAPRTHSLLERRSPLLWGGQDATAFGAD
jgi:hypothetical protein